MNALTRFSIPAAASFALGACATVAPKTAIAPAPMCSSEADCSVKWAAARTFVLGHVGYKLQTYSPDFMETYNPVGGDPKLGAQVNRAPLPSGGYAIVAKFWCDNLFGCLPNQWTTLDEFNRTVAAAGTQ